MFECHVLLASWCALRASQSVIVPPSRHDFLGATLNDFHSRHGTFVEISPSGDVWCRHVWPVVPQLSARNQHTLGCSWGAGVKHEEQIQACAVLVSIPILPAWDLTQNSPDRTSHSLCSCHENTPFTPIQDTPLPATPLPPCNHTCFQLRQPFQVLPLQCRAANYWHLAFPLGAFLLCQIQPHLL